MKNMKEFVAYCRKLLRMLNKLEKALNDNEIEKAKELKGEFVLIIEGAEKKEENDFFKLSLQEHYTYYEDKGLTKKEIIKQIAKDRNVNKNEIYQQFINK